MKSLFDYGVFKISVAIIKLIVKLLMRNTQNESKSPDQGGLKSNKNITSAVAFHLKTENDRSGEQQHHRSPDVSRPELRNTNTWRRAQMPYNKLPEVFNQQKQKKKYGGKVKQENQNLGMIQNLGKLVENSEYKQTQKYLQPLKPKQEKKQKAQRNLFKPIRMMRDMVSKAQEQLKLSEDLAMVKSGPKISQCITLQVIKRGHNTGIIKKMLHVPTLSLVCVRQQPCIQKQSRNFIRDWTKLWRQKLSIQSKSFVTIHEVLYNYPQGAISIFISLLNLLDLTSTLPQSVIRQVYIQLLKIIQKFYTLTQMHFGGLSPSQIMFTQDPVPQQTSYSYSTNGTNVSPAASSVNYGIKLSLGLFYHIPIPESFSIYHIRAQQSKNGIFDFNSTFNKFMKTSIQKSSNLEIQRSVDAFKLGLIALNCAIGNFQNFEQSSTIFNAIRYVFTEQGQKQIQLDNCCCLLHSQPYLLQLVPPQSSNITTIPATQPLKKANSSHLPYLKMLKDRFSIHFISFLCQSLKLSHQTRATLPQLMSHVFILTPHDNDNRTVKIELKDLLAIGKQGIGKGEKIFESGTLQKMDNFIAMMKPVLEYAGRENLIQLIDGLRQRVYHLGKQIGFNSQKFGKKLQEVITQILKKSN